MAKFHTEGIVKDVEFTQQDMTFSLEASAPYLIEEKDSGDSEKSILFIEDEVAGNTAVKQSAPIDASKNAIEIAKDSKKIMREAFLTTTKARFSFACKNRQIYAQTTLDLKQNRTKIRVVVEIAEKCDSPANCIPTFLVHAVTVK